MQGYNNNYGGNSESSFWVKVENVKVFAKGLHIRLKLH